MAKTPLPSEKSKKLGNDVSGDGRKIQKKSLEKLSEIQESWLVDHAKQVNKLVVRLRKRLYRPMHVFQILKPIDVG